MQHLATYIALPQPLHTTTRFLSLTHTHTHIVSGLRSAALSLTQTHTLTHTSTRTNTHSTTGSGVEQSANKARLHPHPVPRANHQPHSQNTHSLSDAHAPQVMGFDKEPCILSVSLVLFIDPIPVPPTKDKSFSEGTLGEKAQPEDTWMTTRALAAWPEKNSSAHTRALSPSAGTTL